MGDGGWWKHNNPGSACLPPDAVQAVGLRRTVSGEPQRSAAQGQATESPRL